MFGGLFLTTPKTPGLPAQDDATADPVRSALEADRPLLLTAFGFGATINLLALTSSLYMLQVYDRVLTSRSEETLLLLTLIAAAAIGVFSVLDTLRLRLLIRLGMRVADRLAVRVFRAMIGASSQSGGSAVRSGLRDVETIRNFIGSPAFATVMDAPFVLIFLVFLYLLHPVFLLIVLIGGGLLAGLALLGHVWTNPVLVRSMGQSLRAHNFAEDALRNSDVLEGMGMSESFATRWRDQWLESLRTTVDASDKDSRITALTKALRLFIQILLLGAGALLILDFRATGGIMIGATIIGSRALAPIEATVATWKTIVAARLARTHIRQVLGTAPRREEGMALPAPAGRLLATAVHFTSPTTRKSILTNIHFEIDAGQSLGIIGPSGSGKSTLLRLLVGAWPCEKGMVRLDGANIYAWPRSDLNKYIGYLPQDVELFAGTVRENIARMTAGDPAEVVRAAKFANAHEMILSLPNGYDTEIGSFGHRLSGGQSQRLGIARALYGTPRLVMLDEPNSNLDGPGEDALMSTLGELKRNGTTVVMVAHRPSVLSTMDKILVLRANGTVESFGPRLEVLQRYVPQPAVRAGVNVVPLQAAQPVDDGNTTQSRST